MMSLKMFFRIFLSKVLTVKSLIKVKSIVVHRRSNCLPKFNTRLATGVIRFLLRDAPEETKSALLEYRILQIIVENSQSVHAGLQCKSTLSIRYRRKISFFSRISSIDISFTGRSKESSNSRSLSGSQCIPIDHIDFSFV